MTREEAYNRIDAIIARHEIDDDYVTITSFLDYDALRMAIKALEQELKWIPVSEKLPSDCNEDWVLAQIQEDSGYLWIPCVAEYRKDKDDWLSDANGVGWLKAHNGAFKVIAWMPLPKPYEPQESEEVNG